MTDATAELTRLRAIVAAQAEVIRTEREEKEAYEEWNRSDVEGNDYAALRDGWREKWEASITVGHALARLLAEGEGKPTPVAEEHRLPCDVWIGTSIRFTAGLPLQTLVNAATRWHKAAGDAAPGPAPGASLSNLLAEGEEV